MRTVGLKVKQLVFVTFIIIMQVLPGNSYCQDKQNPSQNPSQKQQQQQHGQALTAEQTATVKKILSGYNPSTLNAVDARAIQEKFRQAGIHAGPETKDAIIAAGFDPEKLKALAPPRQPDNTGKTSSPTQEDKMKTLQEKIIQPLALTTVQSDVVTKAYTDFYTGMENLRKTDASQQVRPDKSKVEPLEKARDEKISKVLSKEQYAKYKELEKSLRPAKPEDTEIKKNQGQK